MRAQVETCNTCRFWDVFLVRPDPDGGRSAFKGQCKARPPESNDWLGASWPITRHYEGCGAHQPVEVA